MKYSRYIGIDVQINRGCSYFVLGRHGEKVESGWIENDAASDAAARLGEIVRRINEKTAGQVAVGIDAPRQPLQTPRDHYWNSKKKEWRERAAADKGYGRHCEVAVKSLGVGNPQWTRTLEDSPEWMRLGYRIFSAMPARVTVYEVFPSASYFLLNEVGDVKVTVDFSGFRNGPKDMLDACISAVTVREFVLGRGFAVGGGDNLGAIILPRPPANHNNMRALCWPESPGAAKK